VIILLAPLTCFSGIRKERFDARIDLGRNEGSDGNSRIGPFQSETQYLSLEHKKSAIATLESALTPKKDRRDMKAQIA
jgi:hypothetical protein